MRVLVVFGTRPEAIKMAPVIAALRASPSVSVSVCTTGQHREMLEQVLGLFDIRAEHVLDVMMAGQTLAGLTSRIIDRFDGVLADVQPDMVLVHGDTTTSFAAALASFYRRIAVAHVEAGLRTYDMQRPWPEEGNRQLTGRIASLHFAPTEGARLNLISERVDDSRIHVTGNTVIDALVEVTERLRLDSTLSARIASQFPFIREGRRLVLVTGHRRENFGFGFEAICRALRSIASEHDVDVVYPVHLNPNVQGPVHELLGDVANVHLVPPVDYASFVYLMSRSHIILTDSGGVQEEAPSLGKPVLVMRDKTERPEAVAAGVVRLVGTSEALIVAETGKLLSDEQEYERMSKAASPYGDGNAARRIRDVLEALAGLERQR